MWANVIPQAPRGKPPSRLRLSRAGTRRTRARSANSARAPATTHAPRPTPAEANAFMGWVKAITARIANTAMAAGSVVGALVAARRTTATLSVLFLAAAAVGLGLMVLGLTPWFIPFVIVLVIIGFTSVTFNTLGNSSVQLASDPELRGRVMSLYMLVFMGGTPLGSLLIGWITEQWGAPIALILSGGVCIVAAAVSAIFAARAAGISVRVNLHGGLRHLASAERHH